MSIITLMSRIPLYSTIQEALDWSYENGVNGYHVHNYQGRTGYMGGKNHSVAVQAAATPTTIQPAAEIITPTQPIVPPTIQPTTPPPTTYTGGGGTGGGGGY